MSEEKKIIIDEDWKSQVEAEKAAAQQTTADPSDPADAEPGASTTPGGGESPEDPPMPPASMGMLMSSLASEALFAMGHVPHPATGKTEVRRNQAKYLIDTLEMLKEKTTGNLTSEEAIALDDILHQLRMAFVGAG